VAALERLLAVADAGARATTQLLDQLELRRRRSAREQAHRACRHHHMPTHHRQHAQSLKYVHGSCMRVSLTQPRTSNQPKSPPSTPRADDESARGALAHFLERHPRVCLTSATFISTSYSCLCHYESERRWLFGGTTLLCCIVLCFLRFDVAGLEGTFAVLELKHLNSIVAGICDQNVAVEIDRQATGPLELAV